MVPRSEGTFRYSILSVIRYIEARSPIEGRWHRRKPPTKQDTAVQFRSGGSTTSVFQLIEAMNHHERVFEALFFHESTDSRDRLLAY